MEQHISPEAQRELDAYWRGSISGQLVHKLDDPQAAWDSESRLSPYCTVWSPAQDDDAQWQADYDAAIAAGHDDLTATAIADEAAVS